ncbi:MAG: hypothetical protein ACLFR0_04170 [Alphaproteobacteria bacterium]
MQKKAGVKAMSLDKAIDNLQAAFDEVAHEIERAFPKAWRKAAELYTDQDNICDTYAAVHFLIADNCIGWGGKSLVQVAQDYGEDAVIEHIERINAGVYL